LRSFAVTYIKPDKNYKVEDGMFYKYSFNRTVLYPTGNFDTSYLGFGDRKHCAIFTCDFTGEDIKKLPPEK
jgi:hypothetical protein